MRSLPTHLAHHHCSLWNASKKSVSDKLDVVKQLGGIAEETLTAIKVVTSFGREQRELEKFTFWS